MDRDDRLFVPADRVAALMRGGWRMLCAVLLSGSGWLVYRGIDWPLMWRTEPLSCTALAVAAALPAVLGLLATFAAVRWLLVTLWPARLGVEWSADAIRWRLGPFGHGRLRWSDFCQCERRETSEQPSRRGRNRRIRFLCGYNYVFNLY